MSIHASQSSDTELTLGIPGFSYADLYNPLRLKDLHGVFNDTVRAKDSLLHALFEEYRSDGGNTLSPPEVSELLVKMAPHVGEFVAQLFNVSQERVAQIGRIRGEFDSVFVYRNEILAKLDARFKGQNPEQWDVADLQRQFDALVEATAGCDRALVDRETLVSRLAVELWRLTQQIEAVEAGTGERIAALRSKTGTAGGDDAAFIAELFDLVCRWSFAAMRLPLFKDAVKG